jgi:RimJ/RimL family protein N-acetyltransferase
LRSSARIETERLRLDPLTPADADEMAAALSDPGLYSYIGGAPPTPDELRALYEHWLRGPSRAGEAWRNWAVRLVAHGVLIGHVQATVTDGGTAAEIAWVIGSQWQRQGYATEAARAIVEWLTAGGVNTVAAHIQADNRASARVAERIGLEPTAVEEGGETVWRRAVRAADNGADG